MDKNCFGYKAWLQANPGGPASSRGCRRELCGQICEPDFSLFEETSDDAYQQGTRGGVDEEWRKHRPQRCPHNLVSTPSKITGPDVFALRECERGLSGFKNAPDVALELSDKLPPEAYSLKGDKHGVLITGGDEAGLLYGVYGFLSHLRRGAENFDIMETPVVSRRILNHWDNPDGSVERGYAGKSLFWKNGRIGYDLDRLTDYARLLASVGINQISVNNVNVNLQGAKLITDEGLADLEKVAAVFRPFGIRLIIAVHFDSPVLLGGLATADPVDEQVARFWQDAASRVYGRIPDLAGFLMKADSEFRSGPASLGRTQAEGANVIARALQPFGGTIYWRCFVYNCTQDWRDTVTDRPMAAYDYFYPLDGRFDENVIIQIKNGPVDFQVREPNSPLLGAMLKTRQALEFQIAQEYTGHQIDLYNLAVHWEEVFENPVTDKRITRDLIGREVEAVVAVSNTGDDANWTGNLLAQANLYAFGRMAWNPAVTARQVTREWVRLTFGALFAEGNRALRGSADEGQTAETLEPLAEIMLKSRHVYEKYNAPLGIGWMVRPHGHYGPDVDGYEYSKWGTYHRADTKAIGVDRTRAGTGFTAQYHPYVRDMYENKESCPQELLLFFHRLPYDYLLKNGATLLQHIYDTHFEGPEEVEEFIRVWESMKNYMPEDVFASVSERFSRQLANAREWRDVVNTYFYRKTGIPDAKGRRIYP